MTDPIEFLPRPSVAGLLNKPLVDESVRKEAEADVLVHLNRAVDDICACIAITFSDTTFHRLIAGLKELKALQREIEGTVAA